MGHDPLGTGESVLEFLGYWFLSTVVSVSTQNLAVMLVKPLLLVSRPVRGSQSGHPVPPRLLPRHERHPSPRQDVQRPPEVSPCLR